ncbi:fimbrial protein [Steroidobacter agaridevorans]|uniref:Fimbrial protein n=1 Tax=Steroidobacter agaridevorans TaxID=2695856 RepID=A0A829Y922_9GAMM|nr:pilin [Steroidobacter agaridevorans]GFE79072.1 fimbrial protein [Steroidobacter agaridevorans]
MMKQVQKGFTLIELMIVVAIIGILAAIAIPAYQDYTIRAQVTEGATLAGGVKAAMADYYAQRGTWPDVLEGGEGVENSLNFTGAISGNYVESIATTAGTGDIIITYGNNANARITADGEDVLVIYAALNDNQDIVWICGNQTLPAGTEDGVAAGIAETTIIDKYLPRACQQS